MSEACLFFLKTYISISPGFHEHSPGFSLSPWGEGGCDPITKHVHNAKAQVATRQTPQARSGPSESDYLTWEGLSYKQK